MADLPPIAASTEELMDLVAHHVGTVIGMMTPPIAAALLNMNLGNRRKTPKGVRRFKAIALSGAWKNTGEPCVVSKEGLLNDGQHRLQGIVDSGVSVPMDVRFGAPREVFQQMGSGARRTAAKTLHSLGQPCGPTQAAIAKLIYLHDNGLFAANRPSVETPEIVRVVLADPNIATVSKAIQRSKFTPVRSAGVGFPLVLAARVTPIDRVLEFIGLVSTGLTDAVTNPARLLHQRLLDGVMRKDGLDQLEVASITARAWNAWVRGREVRQLKVLPADATGADFPKVLGPSDSTE